MTSLQGKKIILAVTGSIAAYKTPNLVRLLVKAGADVKVITTEAATSLVSPLALSTVSKNPVLHALASDSRWNNHVELGYWADLMLIAPLSANTMAHLAQGFCKELLHAVYLSAKCPVAFAPAMDEDMWHHPAVQHNLELLQSRPNHHYIPVAYGELASGLAGAGRMPEPEELLAWVIDFFENQKSTIAYRGRKALVTAGPTYELLDPVRFIGNFSSGKMGVAIAEVLARKGFNVNLVCGPGVQRKEIAGVSWHHVVSAIEMRNEVLKHFEGTDITVMAAAVADYRPIRQAQEKIKKTTDDDLHIELAKNPDILAELGQKKTDQQVLVGFALETNNEMEYARQKLLKKNADYIALNSLREQGAGFGTDTNKVTLLHKDGTLNEFALQSKQQLAEKMISYILEKEFKQ